MVLFGSPFLVVPYLILVFAVSSSLLYILYHSFPTAVRRRGDSTEGNYHPKCERSVRGTLRWVSIPDLLFFVSLSRVGKSQTVYIQPIFGCCHGYDLVLVPHVRHDLLQDLL